MAGAAGACKGMSAIQYVTMHGRRGADTAQDAATRRYCMVTISTSNSNKYTRPWVTRGIICHRRTTIWSHHTMLRTRRTLPRCTGTPFPRPRIIWGIQVIWRIMVARVCRPRRPLRRTCMGISFSRIVLVGPRRRSQALMRTRHQA